MPNFTSFHTTQYDLNYIKFKETNFRLFTFPYYIVRFKHRNFTLIFFIFYQFPYYIVRFKHSNYENTLSPTASFHTTQYDLNSTHTSYYHWARRFPYYIVRFKLIIKQSKKKKICVRFHTTQYDLNFSSSVMMFFLKKFPYYIVRFKLRTGRYLRQKYYKFPYYIVRFKRLQKCPQIKGLVVSILHSTI